MTSRNAEDSISLFYGFRVMRTQFGEERCWFVGKKKEQFAFKEKINKKKEYRLKKNFSFFFFITFFSLLRAIDNDFVDV
jgi:hypothetical protein